MKTPNYCVVCGVSNKENSETLFKFPKSPTRNQKWLNILGLEATKLKTRSRVCEKHFSSDHISRCRLKKDALPRSEEPAQITANPVSHKKCVPILPRPIFRPMPLTYSVQNVMVPNPEKRMPEYMNDSTQRSAINVVLQQTTDNVNLTDNLPALRTNPSAPLFNMLSEIRGDVALDGNTPSVPHQPIQFSTGVSQTTVAMDGNTPPFPQFQPVNFTIAPPQTNVTLAIGEWPLVTAPPLVVTDPSLSHIDSNNLDKNTDQSTHDLHRLEECTSRKLLRCRRRLYDVKRQLKTTKQKNKEKIVMDEIFADNPIFRDIVKEQIKRYKNKKAPYNDFERSVALSLYYSCGHNGYRTLLSMGMKLPGLSTIRSWVTTFKLEAGINEVLINGIRQMIQNLPEKDRDCIIMWDEMSVKEFIEYNKFTDQFEGIVDLGKSLGKSLETANEKLVFMVQGINLNWKFPVSFYFSSYATKSVDLSKIVEENINCLVDAGLRVRIGVCDMSFTNQSIYKSWGIAPETPYKYFKDKKVIFIHDTPHLIKLVRNNLMKHDFVVSKQVGTSVIHEKIKWLHISQFFRKDRRLTTRMAPRLTNCHLFLKDFSKMKVKLAVQVLSTSVYAGMMAMVRLKLLKSEVKATARFIKTIDDIFDALNTSRYTDDKYGRRGKYFFQNLCKFDDYIKFIKSVSVPSCNRRPEFLHGLELTLCGIKLLALDLKKEGYNIIFTRRLQQDSLENLFSVLRARGGFCRNPTARQVRTNFRYLFFSTMMANPRHGNSECKGKFSNYLGNFCTTSLLKVKQSQSNCRSTKEIERYMETDAPLDSSGFYGIKSNRKLKLGKEQGECAVAYLGGACIHFTIKKTGCQMCPNMLHSNVNDKASNNHLIRFKEFDPLSNKLAYLTSDTLDFFVHLNTNFDGHALKTLGGNGTRIAEGIMEKYLSDNYVKQWLISCNDVCQNHRSMILAHFIKVKIFRLVKDKNETTRESKSWSQTRRDLRNQ